jgi:hypothetical protein
MGIAELEPHQLAPTVGTTGSGSTDLPAPSPIIDNLIASTRFSGPASAMTVDSTSPPDVDSAIDVDTNDKIDIDSATAAAAIIAVPAIVDTNNKIDIDFAIDTAIGIAVPSNISTISLESEVDIAGSTITGIASPSDASLFWPQSSSTQLQARREQFRRSQEASTWPSDCSTSTWTTMESLS